MAIRFETPQHNPSDKRFLIVVLIFGVLGAAAGIRWLSSGSIAIREGGTRIGIGGEAPRPIPHGNERVSGSIHRNDALFIPLCTAWILLGITMIALATIAFLNSNVLFLKLSAYSCLAILLLGFATVAAALWSGP